MKLERIHEYVLVTVVTLAGIGFALYLGRLTGQGQNSTLGAVVGLVAIAALCLGAKTRIWVLVPICWPLGGQMYILPLPFSVRDLCVLLVFGMFLLFKALKIVRQKPVYELLDVFVWANLFYVGSVFLRHPVGTDVLGTANVGGKPYFEAFVGVLAYWILARVTLTPDVAGRLPAYMIGGRLFEGSLSFITFHFPETAPMLSRIYSGVSLDSYSGEVAGGVNQIASAGVLSDRQSYLGAIGSPLILALCSYFRPFTILNPLYFTRFFLFLFGIYCVLTSGHRSYVAATLFAFAAASYFRKGSWDVVRIGLFGIPALILVIAMQGTVFEISTSAQRALSFLPGNWDPDVVADAKGSTKWRTEMWETVLTSDKYIDNKWLGDGFGFTRAQYDAMLQSSLIGSLAADQENQMIVGGVHSGPISAIRFVGVVGLVLYLVLLCYMGYFAFGLITRSKDTPFFVLTLFAGIPIIFEPFNYVILFGGYDSSLPDTLFRVGMLKLLSRSLASFRDAETKTVPAAPVRRIRESTSPHPALAPVGAGNRFKKYGGGVSPMGAIRPREF